MLFGNVRERLQIEGLMPERALLRLKRAGISLYNIQKPHKNRILFSVRRKDLEKVFAIYPDMCYNNSIYHPYRLRRRRGGRGARLLAFCKNRAGFCLGILAFAACVLAADPLVFGVEVVGDTAYTREVQMALRENGIRAYSLYPTGKEDLVTARLLGLRGVEFCSVQKRGHWVRVEIRRAPTNMQGLQKESMTAEYSGIIEEIHVLRGTPLKNVGERVEKGETLVGNWIEQEEKGQVFVEPMARVKIACEYVALFPMETPEEVAFAESYLAIGVCEQTRLTQKQISQTPEGLEVKICYTATQAVNF